MVCFDAKRVVRRDGERVKMKMRKILKLFKPFDGEIYGVLAWSYGVLWSYGVSSEST